METKIIKLNIGGAKYWTLSSQLLSNDTFFKPLIDGKFKTIVDDEGFLFIDRNGKLFEPILNYLRSGKLKIPSELDPQEVLEEMDFYGIDPPLTDVTISRQLFLNNQQILTGKGFTLLKELILTQFNNCLTNAKEEHDVKSKALIPEGTIKECYQRLLKDLTSRLQKRRTAFSIAEPSTDHPRIEEIPQEQHELLISHAQEIVENFRVKNEIQISIQKVWIGWNGGFQRSEDIEVGDSPLLGGYDQAVVVTWVKKST